MPVLGLVITLRDPAGAAALPALSGLSFGTAKGAHLPAVLQVASRRAPYELLDQLRASAPVLDVAVVSVDYETDSESEAS